MSDSNGSKAISSPQVRVRINVSPLVKTGWKHETTVELTFTPIDEGRAKVLAIQYSNESGVTSTEPWNQEMASLLRQANDIGRAEVDRLNWIDSGKPEAA